VTTSVSKNVSQSAFGFQPGPRIPIRFRSWGSGAGMGANSCKIVSPIWREHLLFETLASPKPGWVVD
jgi:hypothetical protein